MKDRRDNGERRLMLWLMAAGVILALGVLAVSLVILVLVAAGGGG